MWDRTATVQNITNPKQAYLLRDNEPVLLQVGDILKKKDIIITKDSIVTIQYKNSITKTIMENSQFLIEE